MRIMLFTILASVMLCLSCDTAGQSPYSFRRGDREGTGMWYMGREIAPVMSHFGIGWLERPERVEEERSDLLMKNLDLKPGEVVADIGAGSGFHAVQMARLVGGSGKVWAVDVQPEMLAYVSDRAKSEGITNLFTLQGSETECRLPDAAIDKMLLVDVYHEFSHPAEMAASMLRALKPGGRLYLVEYRAEDPNVPIKAVHKMSQRQAVREMESAGFRFVKNLSNLPWQHCLIFERP